MNGIEASRIIRDTDGPNKMVPIVAVTANAFSQDRRDCLDAGMNGFLAKPMTREGLAEAILTVLKIDAKPADSDVRTDAATDQSPDDATKQTNFEQASEWRQVPA